MVGYRFLYIKKVLLITFFLSGITSQRRGRSEKKLGKMMTTGNYQFGYCPGMPTTGAMLAMKQLQKQYSQNKKLFHNFVDMEQAFYWVPKAVIR